VLPHNLGLGFFPKDIAAQALKSKTVFEVPLKKNLPERQIVLLQDTSALSSIAETELIHHILG